MAIVFWKDIYLKEFKNKLSGTQKSVKLLSNFIFINIKKKTSVTNQHIY